jgi:hypothetical protein
LPRSLIPLRVLRDLKKFGQSSTWQRIRQSLEAFRDKHPPQEETEEERNARLDEQWRALQEDMRGEMADGTPPAPRAPGEQSTPAKTELAKPGPGRTEREIPYWVEAMAHLKPKRVNNPAIIGKKEERNVVTRWLAERGVEIVEPTDENKERARLNPNLIPYSDKQLGRRISDWFEQPE